ncbi:MAG TPA: acetyl-CoA carboxylase biotin carboxyl carrier protein [Candidatus Acidoferrales bacterium]|jgi:acetyl-CoA carboxylase biotin carboxyl carrier protein|nr:acetyl-CoA carboxylase biotin carboxyl carrier protein [Candidatus Acidoferrales bacterium]
MAKKSNSESQPGSRASGVDLPEVERVLEFMQKHGLEEFEYEREGFRIRLKKPSSPLAATYAPLQPPEIVVASASPHSSRAAAPAQAAPVRESEAAHSEDLHIVKSPIVGTFYTSASPGSEPFVAIGAKVESGQVLCIIEAMKLMNEIESDVAGEVVRIFVENGHPVEYGEALFGIRPHRKK